MNKKIIRTFWTGCIILLVIMLLFIFGDIVTGPLSQAEKIVRSVLILAESWIIIRMITILILDPINEKRGRALPNVIKDIIVVIVFCTALVVIITGVYNKSIMSIGAFFISSWAVIGLAARNVLGDCIHGISLDLQSNFAVGDWVKFKDGTTGKITAMKMTGVNLLLPDSTMLYVPNATLNNEPMINLSRPSMDFFVGINAVLECGAPVDRVRRILYAAAISVPCVHNQDVSVFAESVQGNGIVYAIHFRISDRSQWAEVRHQVIKSVTERINKVGLKVCQITGEVNIRSFEHQTCINIFKEYQDNTSKHPEPLETEVQEKFTKSVAIRTFNKGEIIANTNNAVFIISEGIVEICDKKIFLADGEYCGESPIVAKTNVILYEVGAESFKQFVEGHKDFVRKLSLLIVNGNLSFT